MNTPDTQIEHSRYTEWTLQIHRMNTPNTQNGHSKYTEWTLQIHRMNTPDTQNEHSRYTEWTLQIHRMNTPDTQATLGTRHRTKTNKINKTIYNSRDPTKEGSTDPVSYLYSLFFIIIIFSLFFFFPSFCELFYCWLKTSISSGTGKGTVVTSLA